MTIEGTLSARQDRIDRLRRCASGRTALRVFDMQRTFLGPGAAPEVPPGRDFVPNVQRLVQTRRRRSAPAVFTEFVYSAAVPCLRGDPCSVERETP